MNLRWKGGQLECPNGSREIIVSSTNLFLLLKLTNIKLILITLFDSRVDYRLDYSQFLSVLQCEYKFKFLECVL